MTTKKNKNTVTPTAAPVASNPAIVPARLKEASTWAGIGVAAQIGAAFVPPQYQIYLHGLSALAATLAAGIPEQTPQVAQ